MKTVGYNIVYGVVNNCYRSAYAVSIFCFRKKCNKLRFTFGVFFFCFCFKQQHLLQDTYKSMLPTQGSFGLSHHHHHHSATASPPTTVASAGASAQVPSPRSQRRYTGRATCDCPNCQEAERLGPAGVHLRKKNIHSCHIPGCGKVYGKTSHLKAHLR